jgi:putative spermidine/putrescine transport system permease protein/spermidine/putrescine transport system permease protein
VPGFAAGALMVFVLSLGFYITPALLGGGRVLMVSMAIERAVSYYTAWGAASALGVVLLVATLLVLAVAARLMRLERLVGA